MDQQKKMEESFLRAHREFMENLKSSVDMIASDINEAKEMQQICTDEWCVATETYLDELAKMIYTISEPRWATKEDSAELRNLRTRIHDLYAKYKGVSKK